MNYTVEYWERKKLTLIIERDNSFLVRAPKQATEQEVTDFVNRKKIWIYKKLAEKKTIEITNKKKQYVNGEWFLYLGRSHKLQIVDEQTLPLQFVNRKFSLRRDAIENAEQHFIDRYTMKGNERIEKRLNYFQRKLGRTGQWWGVKDLQYRWWSCTPSNKLYFHWKVMLAPTDVIDYIVLHELIHVVEKKHTKKFRDMMSLAMPWYEKHKEWLKVHWGELSL